MEEYNQLYALLNKIQELAFFSHPDEKRKKSGGGSSSGSEDDVTMQIKDQRLR